MTEKRSSSFPNVSLGRKLNKQKGEKHAGNLRYREKDQSEENNGKNRMTKSCETNRFCNAV